MLILAEIIKFSKKEVIVTLNSKIVLAKMDFCGTGIAKKRKWSIHPFWLELWFGRNYDNFCKSNRFGFDLDSIWIRSNRIEFFFYDSNLNSRFRFDPQIWNYRIKSESNLNQTWINSIRPNHLRSTSNKVVNLRKLTFSFSTSSAGKTDEGIGGEKCSKSCSKYFDIFKF